MTVNEAKELLISGMNYAAYKETERSLFVDDMNRLFGEPHYPPHSNPSGRSVSSNDDWEQRMAQLLEWAVKLGSRSADYDEAIQTLLAGDHYINRIIRISGVGGLSAKRGSNNKE
jgi:hypothetical protein